MYGKVIDNFVFNPKLYLGTSTRIKDYSVEEIGTYVKLTSTIESYSFCFSSSVDLNFPQWTKL